ncbi:hypothetical protein [Citreimonas sp.]|uniref:hypothetical protein n=1 Tax=Citreimonas sp. TaxID=3036715 RepID=UPI0035C7D96D
MSPASSLLAVSAFLMVGGSHWRRTRIRKARRDLPTRMQRLLGPDPTFEPPADPPEGLRDYARLYRRTALIETVLWGLALAWMVFLAYLYFTKGSP